MKKVAASTVVGILLGVGGVSLYNHSIDNRSIEVNNEEIRIEQTKTEKNIEERTIDIGDKYPWEVYDTEEIYSLLENEGTLYLISDAPYIEEAFFNKYQEGSLTNDWGKYLHVFGAELKHIYTENKEYFDYILDAGVAVMNGQYDSANYNMEQAKIIRESKAD